MRKLILASLTISSVLEAQAPPPPRTTPLRGSLERRLTTLLDEPPLNRATWNVYVQDDRGRVLFNRNGDRFSVPASNTKLVVAAAAAVLLPADYRVRTSLYVNGAVVDGVLQGDLILYGRGDPTWSERCFGIDHARRRGVRLDLDRGGRHRRHGAGAGHPAGYGPGRG